MNPISDWKKDKTTIDIVDMYFVTFNGYLMLSKTTLGSNIQEL